ncbi:biotin-dependent carboxyltransferase family protein [Nocardia zapadnayensis]|uniref:5-oxoprolinase subunit C family protein n=1 Tax=Nocardia rhamnosiphila TaxID=426716 RepID=UPI0022474FCB|nr:biotin-dependent carboxyltransferase family protein [Nocardia zapadnayensis]MCX0275254.1 biotin-dependent carboxyltransferase family protein [Nocardia zapadnayensis]
MISILVPGPHTTIQDVGRPGHYAMGLPPSGALDQYAHRCANLLVGNAESAATLESTMAGPTLEFEEDSLVAITGADVAVTVDGGPVQTWAAHTIHAGQQLAIGPARAGARSYLAVRGGIDCPPFLGSRSTYTAAGIGGLAGKRLAAGDTLQAGSETAAPPRPGAHLDSRLHGRPGNQVTVRVVPGLCNYRFTAESLEQFFTSTYTMTTRSDRIGCRLDGPRLTFVEREQPFGAGDNPSNVVDLGYPVGSVQVPNGAEPICLLRDAVTGGGYATLGTVISADLDLLAQARAPDTIRFEPVSVDDALVARAEYRARLRDARTNLNLLSLF